jgi:hypothetical protein
LQCSQLDAHRGEIIFEILCVINLGARNDSFPDDYISIICISNLNVNEDGHDIIFVYYRVRKVGRHPKTHLRCLSLMELMMM